MKILLNCPDKRGDYYKRIIVDLADGFKAEDCEVKFLQYLPDVNELNAIVESFRPDFVFEINRCRNEVPGLIPDVVHCCWLLDDWGRRPEDICGSEILFLFNNGWRFKFKRYKGIVSVLRPAVNPEVFLCSQPFFERTYRYGIFGHISLPWTEEELERDVFIKKDKAIKFKDLIPVLDIFALQDIPNYRHYWAFKDKTPLTALAKYFDITDINPISEVLLYDITARAIRYTRRLRAANSVRSISESVVIYGSYNWHHYDEFSPFYRGYLDTQVALNAAMNNVQIVVDDTRFPHFRVYEALASGCLVINPSYSVYSNEWKGYKNIIPFNPNLIKLTDTYISEIISNRRKFQRDLDKARGIILNKHTWQKRAQQISSIVKKYKGG